MYARIATQWSTSAFSTPMAVCSSSSEPMTGCVAISRKYRASIESPPPSSISLSRRLPLGGRDESPSPSDAASAIGAARPRTLPRPTSSSADAAVVGPMAGDVAPRSRRPPRPRPTPGPPPSGRAVVATAALPFLLLMTVAPSLTWRADDFAGFFPRQSWPWFSLQPSVPLPGARARSPDAAPATRARRFRAPRGAGPLRGAGLRFGIVGIAWCCGAPWICDGRRRPDPSSSGPPTLDDKRLVPRSARGVVRYYAARAAPGFAAPGAAPRLRPRRV